MRRYVVIGSGIAGHRAALKLRELDQTASIDLFGDEASIPYDRTTLSKDFLLGNRAETDIQLSGASDYADLRISYHAGRPISRIDKARHTVTTADGGEFGYDRLLLATGSSPRRLGVKTDPAAKLHYMRTLTDARALRELLRSPRRFVVIGGGFIGLEFAAAARAQNSEVVLLETAPCLLARTGIQDLSNYLSSLHQRNGIELRLNTTVTSIAKLPESGLAVHTGATSIAADCVVIGIGIQPNDQLASSAGLEVNNGIVVDHSCRTSDEDIFAAGEVTAHPSGFYKLRQRVESWTAAAEQSVVAARAIAGEHALYNEEPWFWSDQFGQNVQSLGSRQGVARSITIGETSSDHWTQIFVRQDERIAGAVAVNDGRNISVIRRSIGSGMTAAEVIPHLEARMPARKRR